MAEERALLFEEPDPVSALDERIENALSVPAPDRNLLAQLIPESNRLWHAVGNVSRLRIGRNVWHFKRLELWREHGCKSFLEYWKTQGLEGVDYKTVNHWATYWHNAQRAGLSELEAAQQSERKLVAASSVLKRAEAEGNLSEEIRHDLMDPDIGREEFLDRHVRIVPPAVPPLRDRVTVDSSTGRIVEWLDTHNPPVLVEMGQAALDDDSLDAWQRLMDREVEIDWV